MPSTDFNRDLSALAGPTALDISRKLEARLFAFDRVTVLANRTGRPLSITERHNAGATNPEAVLADVRSVEGVR